MSVVFPLLDLPLAAYSQPSYCVWKSVGDGYGMYRKPSFKDCGAETKLKQKAYCG